MPEMLHSEPMTGTASLPTSVVVPTIGRVELLRQCLLSLLACEPAPAEIIVVDQSGAGAIVRLVQELDSGDRIRVVTSDGRGSARAINDGVRAVRHPTVLLTHDDCTVAHDWIGQAARLLETQRTAIFTGRVLPPDGSAYVPSTVVGRRPVDYTGRVTSGVLYPANMVFDRDVMTEFGGFDVALRVAAEDNDLCYRWLRDGRTLRFEPSLVVWHHDWRSPEQMLETHLNYARGQGAFYAKHLLAKDRLILPLLLWDLRQGIESKLRWLIHQTPRWQDPNREMIGPLLRGVASELWRERKRLS
jgi:GT2 family glycosyltransferase